MFRSPSKPYNEKKSGELSILFQEFHFPQTTCKSQYVVQNSLIVRMTDFQSRACCVISVSGNNTSLTAYIIGDTDVFAQ